MLRGFESRKTALDSARRSSVATLATLQAKCLIDGPAVPSWLSLVESGLKHPFFDAEWVARQDSVARDLLDYPLPCDHSGHSVPPYSPSPFFEFLIYTDWHEAYSSKIPSFPYVHWLERGIWLNRPAHSWIVLIPPRAALWPKSRRSRWVRECSYEKLREFLLPRDMSKFTELSVRDMATGVPLGHMVVGDPNGC